MYLIKRKFVLKYIWFFQKNNLEELTLEGYRDILKINPLEIITHKNLKILNFKDSQFFDFNSKTISKIDIDEESYNKSIDWCEKRISK